MTDELFDLYDVSNDGVTPPAPSECYGLGLSRRAGCSTDIRHTVECHL